MTDINFDIAKHWLPVSEKQGSIEKDTLRIKVAGINFHKNQKQAIGEFLLVVLSQSQAIHMILMLLVSINLMDNFWDMFKKSCKIMLTIFAKGKSWTV